MVFWLIDIRARCPELGTFYTMQSKTGVGVLVIRLKGHCLVPEQQQRQS